jgi:hypothetical protein
MRMKNQKQDLEGFQSMLLLQLIFDQNCYRDKQLQTRIPETSMQLK